MAFFTAIAATIFPQSDLINAVAEILKSINAHEQILLKFSLFINSP